MRSNDALREVFRLRGLTLARLGKQVARKSLADGVSAHAAQIAFYAFFALLAFLLFLTAAVAYLPIAHPSATVMALLRPLVPSEGLSLVEQEVAALVDRGHAMLLLLSAGSTLWSGASGVAAIAEGANRAYGVHEGRPGWKIQVLGMMLAGGVALLLVVALASLVFGGAAVDAWVVHGENPGWLAFAILIVRWSLLLLALTLSTAIIYAFAPDLHQRWRWVTPGAVFTVVAWLIAWLPFAYYVHHFSTYSITAGAISGVIVLLLWMYVTGLLLLIGSEINAVIEHAAPSGKDWGAKDYDDEN